MPTNLSKSEFYRREADRLRTMAGSASFADVQDELLGIAKQFAALSAAHDAKWPRAERATARLEAGQCDTGRQV